MKLNVPHIAKLANLPISSDEESVLETQLTETLTYVEMLQEIDTKNVKPTAQVTGLENVWREDVVDSTRTFSQEQALANASHVHDGYFVVPQLISE